MTLSEIKDQVAQECGRKDWKELKIKNDSYVSEHLYDEVSRRYARQYAEEDRKDCAEKATTKHVILLPGYEQIQVDKDSILNRPYPQLK